MVCEKKGPVGFLTKTCLHFHRIHDNYEWKLDSNVPRSGMFEHYRQHCISQGVKALNSATLGKLIRTAFPEISTRRLGTRGRSQYQYCNIQLKPSIEISNSEGLAPATVADNTPSTTASNNTAHGFPSVEVPPPVNASASSGTVLFSVPRSSRPRVVPEKSPSCEPEEDSPEFKALSIQFERHYHHHCILLYTTIYTGAFDKVRMKKQERHDTLTSLFSLGRIHLQGLLSDNAP